MSPIRREIIICGKHQEMNVFAKNASDLEYKSYLETV